MQCAFCLCLFCLRLPDVLQLRPLTNCDTEPSLRTDRLQVAVNILIYTVLDRARTLPVSCLLLSVNREITPLLLFTEDFTSIDFKVNNDGYVEARIVLTYTQYFHLASGIALWLWWSVQHLDQDWSNSSSDCHDIWCRLSWSPEHESYWRCWCLHFSSQPSAGHIFHLFCEIFQHDGLISMIYC